MSIKVELPSNEAQRLMEEWERRAEQLDGELSELKSAIASVKAQLNGKLPGMDMPTQRTEAPSGKSKKGENLRIVKSYMDSIGEKGATTAEISAATGVGKSSVYIVLTKYKTISTKAMMAFGV